MPAYSFKERFVPFLLDGSKPHTIRARRRYPAKKDDVLYLYSGLRTKFARKLREERCTEVRTIIITAFGTVFLHKGRITDDEYNSLLADPSHYTIPLFDCPWKVLTMEEKEILAWKDGFRPSNTSKHTPNGAFSLMLHFWKQTHALPFIGDIIYWEPWNTILEPVDGAFCD